MEVTKNVDALDAMACRALTSDRFRLRFYSLLTSFWLQIDIWNSCVSLITPSLEHDNHVFRRHLHFFNLEFPAVVAPHFESGTTSSFDKNAFWPSLGSDCDPNLQTKASLNKILSLSSNPLVFI